MKHATALTAAAILLVLAQLAGAQSVSFSTNPAGGFTFQPPGVDPDTASTVKADVTLSWTVHGGGQNPAWTILMHANGDLTSGADTIPVTSISWTGTGGLASGTALSTSDQQLIQGAGKGTFSGTLTFSLPNLWTYNAGTYTTTIVFTAVSP